MRNELERVLQYPQIAPRMAFYGHSTEQLLQRMDAVVQYVEPAGPAGVSCKDTDDQCFVDLAAAHQAILLSKDAQVLKLRKRLDLARDAERAIDAVPGRIVAGWGGLKHGHDGTCRHVRPIGIYCQ